MFFHDRVDTLGLPIGLWVEGRGKARSDSEAGAHVSPEVGGELGDLGRLRRNLGGRAT